MRISGLLTLAGAVALAGCPNAELAPLEPCTVSGVVREVQQNAVDQVDVLFVVDNSNSMEQEQVALARELPRMVEILASGDLEAGTPDGTMGKGESDFPAVKDLHLGVVSTDMGAAGNDPSDMFGCGDPGDDGLLLANPMCGVTGNYLSFNSETDNPTDLGQAFGCITQLGTAGCGQEMQLDAMLKALVPANSGIPFFTGAGHGGPTDPNGGFLRENAVLAVIIVTDEDDCSVKPENADLLAFTPGSAYDGVPLNLRCVGTDPNLQHPASRYHDALLALKPQNPELVIFAAITGIPLPLEGMNAADINNDPSMQFKADRDAADPQAKPVPSCTFTNPDAPDTIQLAFPPRRIVEVAGTFGANGTVQSICQANFSGALTNIVEKISAQLGGACLPRPLVRTDQGVVACDIVELIADDELMGDARCPAARGREPLRRDPGKPGSGVGEYQVCKINQVAVKGSDILPNPETGGSIGWYYDDFSDGVMEECKREATQQRITFTPGAQVPSQATVRFECLQPVLDFGVDPKGKEAVGFSCEDAASTCSKFTCDQAKGKGCEKNYGLTCESQSNTCQISCTKTSQCPNGWQCKGRQGAAEGVCILPTCPAIEF